MKAFFYAVIVPTLSLTGIVFGIEVAKGTHFVWGL